MKSLTVIVPILPPTVNHMYRSAGNGRKVLTDEVHAFRKHVWAEATETARLTGWTLPDGALELHMFITYGNKRNTDIDNRIKSAVDALAIALGFNDARIDRLVVERAGIEKDRPLCEMVLMERTKMRGIDPARTSREPIYVEESPL